MSLKFYAAANPDVCQTLLADADYWLQRPKESHHQRSGVLLFRFREDRSQHITIDRDYAARLHSGIRICSVRLAESSSCFPQGL